LPVPQSEFAFHPVRKWRVDFAYPDKKIAIEVEGGIYTKGRHVRGQGYEKDCEKYNELAICGWRLIRATPTLIKKGIFINQLERAYKDEDS
jgi:very-short-patch-repair endonuclease